MSDPTFDGPELIRIKVPGYRPKPKSRIGALELDGLYLTPALAIPALDIVNEARAAGVRSGKFAVFIASTWPNDFDRPHLALEGPRLTRFVNEARALRRVLAFLVTVDRAVGASPRIVVGLGALAAGGWSRPVCSWVRALTPPSVGRKPLPSCVDAWASSPFAVFTTTIQGLDETTAAALLAAPRYRIDD